MSQQPYVFLISIDMTLAALYWTHTRLMLLHSLLDRHLAATTISAIQDVSIGVLKIF